MCISFVNYTASFSCKLDNGKLSSPSSISLSRRGDISSGINSEALQASTTSFYYFSHSRITVRRKKKKNVVSVRGNKTLCEFSQTTFVLIIISRSINSRGAIHGLQNPGSILNKSRSAECHGQQLNLIVPRNYNAGKKKLCVELR